MSAAKNANSNSTLLISRAVFALCLFSTGAHAADPQIHVAWDDMGTPTLGLDYFVITASPASSEFPDVQLQSGSLTWKVWSVDTDNPSDIGDIGVISSPAAANFGVKIMDSNGAPGARNVKGIILNPTNSERNRN